MKPFRVILGLALPVAAKPDAGIKHTGEPDAPGDDECSLGAGEVEADEASCGRRQHTQHFHTYKTIGNQDKWQ
jgi:hypothetical protein